jgi:hypothetical protein
MHSPTPRKQAKSESILMRGGARLGHAFEASSNKVVDRFPANAVRVGSDADQRDAVRVEDLVEIANGHGELKRT